MWSNGGAEKTFYNVFSVYKQKNMACQPSERRGKGQYEWREEEETKMELRKSASASQESVMKEVGGEKKILWWSMRTGGV